MNENNIVSIDALIDRIKIRGYIDCNEDGYYDEYEYDNILYYLEKYKNLQSKIDKAIELNENIRKKLLTCSSYEKDEVENLLFKQLDILKEDE